MKKLGIGLVVIVVVGIAAWWLMPSGENLADSMDSAGAGDAQQVTVVDAADTDQVVDLNAGNTDIGFSCAKTVAGKTLAVHGGWSGDFDSRLTGTAVIDPSSGTVRQLQVEIDMGTLWSEHEILTDALLTKGFFQVADHPTATFVSTAVREGVDGPVSLEGATHTIEGNFRLNGIERSLTFPAIIELSDSSLQLTSAFSIDRKVFNVNFTDSAGFGLLTDKDIANNVALKVKVNASLDGEEAVAAVTTNQVESTEPAAPVDIASLPQTYTETIPCCQIDFDLVLVPGSEEEGIRPMYVGAREVSWDEFMPWYGCNDVEDSDTHGVLRAKKLRPSLPYGDITRGFGSNGYPALSMSRLSAELYCKWLSKQTGKTFRLPTESEWEYIYRLGGGDPSQPVEDPDAVAVYEGNSEDDLIGDWATRPTGSMAPNSLGIYDMAGNVCEWVITDGTNRVARGGHFESTPDELGVGRDVEDPSWNKNYPNEPKSIWWFVDARWVGFRVVQEL